MEELPGAADIGAALPGIILWQGLEFEPDVRADERNMRRALETV
jgi:hypothetical protein